MPDAMDALIWAAKDTHDALTDLYYSDPASYPGGKEAFDSAHAAIWTKLDQDLVAGGHVDPPGPTLEERVAQLELLLWLNP